MSQRKGANAAVSPGQRTGALAPHLVSSSSATTFAPAKTVMPAVVRAPSYDPAAAARIRVPSVEIPNSGRAASPIDSRSGARAFSRGAQPGVAMQGGKYVITPSHRGQIYQTVPSAPLSHRVAQTARQTSRSPPPTPLKYNWEPVTGSSSARRVTPVPAEPVMMMMGAAGPQHPARVHRISSGPFNGLTSGPSSSQSLPSAASCPTVSGVTTQTLAPMANRGAHSASILPMTPAVSALTPCQTQAGIATVTSVSSMPTLHNNDVQAPWAQVINQTTARMGESQPPAHVYKAEDLEKVRREINEQKSAEAEQYRQILLINQKDLLESRAKADSLHAENHANKLSIQEAQEKLRREIEQREQTERSLTRVSEDYDQAVREKDCLEEHQRQEDAAQEQMKRKFADLEKRHHEAQEQYHALESMRNAEKAQAGKKETELQEKVTKKNQDLQHILDEKLQIEAELTKQLRQKREVEAVHNELQNQVVILGNELSQAQDELRRAEQDHNSAQQEVKKWYQKVIDGNKENDMFQRYHQEHKKVISGLEVRLRQEQDAATIVSPGDFLKFMKANEEGSLAQENSSLKKELAKRQLDLDLCTRKIKEQSLLLGRLSDAHK